MFTDSAAECLGDAKVDDLGNRCAVKHGDENVAGFQIAVENGLRVRVLDGEADGHEQFEPFSG